MRQRDMEDGVIRSRERNGHIGHHTALSRTATPDSSSITARATRARGWRARVTLWRSFAAPALLGEGNNGQTAIPKGDVGRTS